MRTFCSSVLFGPSMALALGSSMVSAEFDIQGLEIGQSHENSKEIATSLAGGPDRVEDRTIVFLSQARRQVEESAHVVSYSFESEDSQYVIELARKPLDESVKRIRRFVEYDRSKLEEAPSLKAYISALKDKYGEPVENRETTLKRTKSHNLIFTDNSPSGKCPDKVIKSRGPASQWPATSELGSCGTILHVDVTAINQPSEPVVRVTMMMLEPEVFAKDERGYEAYWNQWMQEYLAERGASGEPTL